MFSDHSGVWQEVLQASGDWCSWFQCAKKAFWEETKWLLSFNPLLPFFYSPTRDTSVFFFKKDEIIH